MMRKGMTPAIALIAATVVIFAVGLIVITGTTSNLSGIGTDSGKQQGDSACALWKTTVCVGKASGVVETNPSISDCTVTCSGAYIPGGGTASSPSTSTLTAPPAFFSPTYGGPPTCC